MARYHAWENHLPQGRLMPYSFSQITSLTSPQCYYTFESKTVLIVDTAKRPNLLGQVRHERLHVITCPHY